MELRETDLLLFPFFSSPSPHSRNLHSHLSCYSRRFNTSLSFEAFESDNRFFLNPGSATGSFSPLWTPPPPQTSTSSPSASSPPSSTADDKKDPPTQTKEDSKEEEESVQEGPTPSFALLDIQGNVVVTYVYTEKQGDVSVEKMEFRKQLP